MVEEELGWCCPLVGWKKAVRSGSFQPGVTEALRAYFEEGQPSLSWVSEASVLSAKNPLPTLAEQAGAS